ncbi:MAG: hypothetical protein ABSH00_10355 [Bryobacteraceae bacterium]|jgi:hypothetical protein
MIPERLMRTTLSMVFAVVLLVTASAFLLAAVSFGITRGEMRIGGPDAQQCADRLNRAANIAVGLFLFIELGATLLILKSGAVSRVRVHWSVRSLVSFAVATLCSYGLVLLSLSGRVPDLLLGLEQRLSGWVMGAH